LTILFAACLAPAFMAAASPGFAADDASKAAAKTSAKKIAKKEEPPIPALSLSIAVASVDGKAVRDDAWIDAQLTEVERLFGPIGVSVRKAKSRPLDQRFARLETRADRDALAAELERGVVNVFIVASLRDVDEPDRYRMGVHWHKRSDTKKHYVIVSASAMPSTLAHELGHFFGNGHSKVVNNLMSYERTGDAVFIDERQAATIRAFARNYLRAKELLPFAGEDANSPKGEQTTPLR